MLQYMAAGLPVVANPVGVHCELVRHGETGYLVSSAEEWSAAIRRLAADPKLRRRLGEAGRRHLERAYAVEVGAVRWLEVFQQLSVRPAA
ncbi:MAG: glycosyltransferase [Gemmataceae bacterium]|nr:glycosyltransferase [Gemmataceae bacterium]